MALGAWRGMTYEIVSVLGWAASFYLAQLYAPSLGVMLPMGGAHNPLRYGVGFLLIFIVAVFLFGILAVVLRKLLSAVGLGPLDRTMGALFGMVRGVILLLAATVVINMTGQQSEPWWNKSEGAVVLNATLKSLKPVLPEQFAKYL
jgi:membrane protein required for colicin V production